MSLLGLDARAPFQIEVEGWLGAEADEDAPLVMPELLKIDRAKIQCFYGDEEDDSICPDPQLAGAEIIRTKGGHHFDGDYARARPAHLRRRGAARSKAKRLTKPNDYFAIVPPMPPFTSDATRVSTSGTVSVLGAAR